jgi:chromosome segregation ATPase
MDPICIAITHKGKKCTSKAKAWRLCGVHCKGLKKEVDHLQGQLVQQRELLEAAKQEQIRLADQMTELGREIKKQEGTIGAEARKMVDKLDDEFDRLVEKSGLLTDRVGVTTAVIAEIIRRLKGLGVEA